ncbi:MAG: FAD-dependent oxidoreductase [Chloroflexi bacterium]|nr:FAD-dependent oxidoreductase [Chloroflexota bacterium]MCI0580988.1 FAD-dependent oxidoreductase [Chloroflexota bacterium]MCI0646327.1 FAD-dependent oxidoreductase [Chloroflexota bacterium]MCI0726975.1 FAD-dependent oxidoreductase [Chloroflexota bacterium]
MSQAGTQSNPLRVAIIGAGPAGFYAVERLFKQKDLTVEVDMYDRLPTPYGLVRNGVAPDHQKIKSVTKVFDRLAAQPQFRFFGYVELGKDITVADLRRHYHQIVYTTGAQTDRSLNIPGIDLKGSHAATEFVAWYNGHPDYRHYQFDLSQEHAVVIGVGNVAVDVCRILCRTPEELARTDIAGYALEALSQSRVKVVYMLGRRGPAQAAYTAPEVKELGELADADVIVLPEEAELDELSQASLADGADRGTMRQVELIQEFSRRPPAGKSRQLILRFLVSPVELIGDENGQVICLRLVKNELYATEAGSLRARPTEQYEEIPAGLVFRSIGYQGVPLPDVPFNDNWGVILNEGGRVIHPETRQPVVGEYAAGWIKRGPTGVIGTNKPDAAETVELMLKDLASGRILSPECPDATAAEQMVRKRQPHYFSYEDWLKLDEIEVARGTEQGRPRVKLTTVEEMLAAVGKK